MGHPKYPEPEIPERTFDPSTMFVDPSHEELKDKVHESPKEITWGEVYEKNKKVPLFQAKLKKKYIAFMRAEFFHGGNLDSMADKLKLPVSMILHWIQTNKEFKEQHDKAVEYNITSFSHMLVKHMSEGFTFETFAAKIGEYPAEVNRWLKDYPEFKAAKSLADAGLMRYLQEIGLEALTEQERFPSSTYMAIMRNMAGWKDPGEGKKDKGNKKITNNVVIMLPEKKRQIDKGSVIEIREVEEAPLDMNALAEG